MVGFKAASMAVLLGSAVLTSAAAVPKYQLYGRADVQERDEAPAHSNGKRMWRGRLGARGPWRDETVKRSNDPQDHYLINIDLSGDGPHQNGVGDLIDLNTRGLLDTPFDRKSDAEKKKDMQRWHFGSSGKGGKSRGGKNKRSGPAPPQEYSLVDIGASIEAALKNGKRGFIDLTAQLGLLNPTKREWEEFESLASSLGVQDDDIAAAKKAATDNLTPEQQKDVMNAVKKAVWDSQHHGEKRAVPGPAFLFRARDVEEEEEAEKAENREAVQSLLSLDAKIKVLGDTPEGETGVMSTDSGTKYGVPLVVAGAKREEADDKMEGAPGYIDITSPVFDSSAQRIASLVLSTSNDTSTNSSFVLNASSNIRTQVYLVPVKVDAKAQPGSAAPGAKGDLIKVNLKVPVFVADTATVEPYCATFDPSPDAPSPMTVEPCEDVSNDMPESEGTPEVASASASEPVSAKSTSDKSQVFLFDPETGVVKPDWGGSTASAKSVDDEDEKDEEPQTSSVAPPTSTSTSSSSTSSASASSTSAAFAAKAAETSSLSSLPAPSAPTAPTTPSSPASSTPVEAYPSETSSIPELPKLSSAVPNVMAAPLSYVHTASAPASMLPHPSASAAASSLAGAVPSAPVPMPVQPSVSAAASHPASSVAGAVPTPSVSAPAISKPAPVNAAAASSAPAVSSAAASSAPAAAAPSASAPAAPVNQGNNVTLIFSPSQASVLSKDKDETASAVNLSPDADHDASVAAASADEADEMDEINNEDGQVEAASTEDDENEDDEENDLNSEDGAGLVARSHKQEDDCDDADGYSVKSASTKSKPKAKLPEGQENQDQGETKKISLGKGGVAVEDANKLKEESAADKAEKEKVKAKAAKASSAPAHSKLAARFLRRQQTVLQAKDFDATAPYE